MSRAPGALLLAGLAGCTGPGPSAPLLEPTPDAARVSSELPGPAAAAFYGQSVEGRPLEARVLGGDGPALLVLASIHGDEGAGTPLVERLALELARRPELAGGRRVVIVPRVNPDGLARRTRHNAGRVDLNRNFPAANRRERREYGPGPLSEPESRALGALIRRHQPVLVVSLHQPIGCVDWDGPGERVARAMAEACGLPARKLGSRPGSLGAWLGDGVGVPVVTLELPRAADRCSGEELWERYGPALLVALVWE